MLIHPSPQRAQRQGVQAVPTNVLGDLPDVGLICLHHSQQRLTCSSCAMSDSVRASAGNGNLQSALQFLKKEPIGPQASQQTTFMTDTQVTDITDKLRARQLPTANIRAEDMVAEIEKLMGEQLIGALYRDAIRPLRTRSYALNAPIKTVPVEILHTLLGIELKIGKRRLLCPDLATARYLAVFAKLGVGEIAVPYDITQISRLADALESSWFRMLTLTEHLTAERSNRLRSRVFTLLVAGQRQLVTELGAGPAIPQFIQNTKQRQNRN